MLNENIKLRKLNENNWHEFLDNAIEGSLTSRKDRENGWINNIFENLHICCKAYALMFGDIAEYYYKLVFSGSKENILKVFKFIDAPLRNVRQHTKIMGAEKPFRMWVENYFETGKTPIDNLPKALPDIKSPPHLIRSALSSISKLYEKFRSTRAKWMLSAFFIAQLFREITDSDNLSSEHLVINMLEELLFNCFGRELKTNPKEQNIQFHDAEYLPRTFVRILTQEQFSNRGQ